MIRTVAILLLLLCTRAVCIAQPAVMVESDPQYQISMLDQRMGGMVWGNDEYFAVWCDRRHGWYDIYFQRLTSDGVVKDPGSRVLMHDARTKVSPCVAWNGSVYLVCYQDGTDFYGQRVSASGDILDPAGFFIHDFSVNNGYPAAITSDGQDFLVTWSQGTNIFCKRITAQGQVLDAAPIVLSSGGVPTDSRVAYGAGHYVVTWSLNASVRALRLTSSGTLLDPVGGVTVATGVSGSPTPFYDGENFMVIYRLRDAQNYVDIMSIKLSPSLNVLAGPYTVVEGDTWGHVGIPYLTSNGSHYLVGFSPPESPFFDDAYAVLMDANGFPMGGPFVVSDRPNRSSTIFSVASDGTNFFTVWVCHQNSPGVGSLIEDIYGARITSWGQVLDPDPTNKPVSMSASWQRRTTSSFDGQRFLVAFEDRRVGPPLYLHQIYGLFLDQNGQPTTASAFPICTTPGTKEFPRSIFAAGQHLVVFESPGSSLSHIRAVRVLPDGSVLDPEGIIVATSLPSGRLWRPQVAWNGSRYCVVYYDDYIAGGTAPLRYVILRPDGTTESGPFFVPSSTFASFSDFQVTSNGNEFAIAWSSLDVLRATRISTTGQVLSSSILASSTSSSTYWEFPQIAWNGAEYLVLTRRYSSGSRTIEARRVTAQGAPVGGVLNLSPAFQQDRPKAYSLIGSGSEFHAYWTQPEADPNLPHLLMRTRLGGGSILGTEPMRAFPDLAYGDLALGFGPDAQPLTTYSAWTRDPYNAPRAYAVRFGGAPACYANCDGSTQAPVLNVADFTCFLQKFAAGDPYANCDGSTQVPVLNVADFTCFLQKFAAGCP